MPLAFRRSELAVALIAVLIVGMMIIPVPPLLLDVFLTFNIAAGLVILLVALYAAQPLEFSSLPSLLLISTLFRLALNVSSTRLLLLTGEAGAVIRQFGEFVVGGNPAVGLIVFLILVIIQFVVITRGAERISEVAARFTLDAMPGKQMAIDADLNAGLLTEAQARERRQAIQREADFYGAMDGASKFVKGDAIAGLIILVVNLVGGLAVGILQLDMGVGEAWAHFSLMTIGDGLVSQIPALLVSTATAVVVTRAAGQSGLGEELSGQLLGQPRILVLAGAVLGALALVPGLPTWPFLLAGAALGGFGLAVARSRPPAAPAPAEAAGPPPAEAAPENMHALLPVDPLEIELGYGLVPLAEAEQGGDLVERLVAVRRQIATGLGLVVPYIRVRDNLTLEPDRYVIRLRGAVAGEFTLHADRLLAIDSGSDAEPLPGIATADPAFGLPAVWIPPGERQRAELAGYTVVEPVAVIVAHVTEVIKQRAHELLGRQEVKALVDLVRESHPALVEELTPRALTLGEIQKVLQNLLREGVSIRDLVLIFEALADWAPVTRDITRLTEQVRVALSRTLAQQYGLDGGKAAALTLDPDLEQELLRYADQKGGGLPLPPDLAQGCLESLAAEARRMAASGRTPLLLAPPALRPLVRRLAEMAYPSLVVLSYAELDPRTEIEAVGVVRACTVSGVT